MAIAIGSISKVSVGASSVNLSVAAATGGTAPITYQWYQSKTTGFTPGSATLISGATSLSVAVSGLTPSTQYYFEVVATDASAVTASSAQLSVATVAASPNPNQFALAPYLGMLDLRFNGNTIAAQLDISLGASATLVGGQAVKFTITPAGLPQVIPCVAASDACCGFVNYDIKSAVFLPGNALEISMAGNVMYLQATAAINRGQFLTQLPSAVAGGTIGGVVPVTGSSGFPIIGYALDSVVSGSLVRVMLTTPANSVNVD